MVDPKDWLEFGQKFHGHKCPAMPNGLRVGSAAMNALGVERTGDSALHAILDLGENHCATCFADGIQVITGCTFGKGNIEKTHRGKWALTLIDKKTNRAVRVTPTAEAMLANKKTSFFKDYREKGVPPTQVPDDVVEPLVVKVMNAPEDKMMKISEVFEYQWKQPVHSFNSFVCEECGEMTVMEYGRVKGDKKVCMECAAK
ncbi:FmdE family protein [Saccharicrinis sp. FJH62]|uniref:FmdE family protein n=1 Tax=Saccharicrinis sp. FJH62 TaxID=3344657 RepID=UPI0035D4CB52